MKRETYQSPGGKQDPSALLQALGVGPSPQTAMAMPGAAGTMPAPGMPGSNPAGGGGAESSEEEMAELMPLLLALLQAGGGPETSMSPGLMSQQGMGGLPPGAVAQLPLAHMGGR